VRQLVPELNNRKNATSAKAKRLLGWTPRSRDDAILAAAESLGRLGLVGDRRKVAAFNGAVSSR